MLNKNVRFQISWEEPHIYETFRKYFMPSKYRRENTIYLFGKNVNVAFPITNISPYYYVNFLKCICPKICVADVFSSHFHLIEIRRSFTK